MRNWVLILMVVFTGIHSVSSQEPTRWRGPSADGIYPGSELLKSWPADGPDILWSFEQLGEGYASPAIYGGHIYIPTMLGDEGYMFKLTMSGKQVWKAKYGTEYTDRYPGTRSTATIAGDLLYMLSGVGKLVCMNTSDGSVRWSKELTGDFDGAINRYGYNESIVVEGNRLYVTPGGSKNNFVHRTVSRADWPDFYTVWRTSPANGSYNWPGTMTSKSSRNGWEKDLARTNRD